MLGIRSEGTNAIRKSKKVKGMLSEKVKGI